MVNNDLYDIMADEYDQICHSKKLFINSVNELVFDAVKDKRIINFLDVGPGDAARTKLVVSKVSPGYVAGTEPSYRMYKLSKASDVFDDICNSSIQEYRSHVKFDLIVALWNVFGHMQSRNQRLKALINIRNHMSDGGVFVVDINNRHCLNYGFVTVLKNMLMDALGRPTGVFPLPYEDKIYEVYLHKPGEFETIVTDAGLSLISQYAVNYKNGKIKKNGRFCGQLVYVLAKS